MTSKNWIGMIACTAIIGSSFMHWTWYPDLQKYFTGFFTEKNYYGRPGLLLTFIATMGMASYLFNKVWLSRLNLIFSGIGMAYAIKSFLLYVSAYDGYVPEPQPGLYIMISASLVHVIVAMLNMGNGKMKKAAFTND